MSLIYYLIWYNHRVIVHRHLIQGKHSNMTTCESTLHWNPGKMEILLFDCTQNSINNQCNIITSITHSALFDLEFPGHVMEEKESSKSFTKN